MNILKISALIATFMLVALLIERTLIPCIKKAKNDAKVLDSQYTNSLFNKASNYISATRRKNSDFSIDNVFNYDEIMLTSIKNNFNKLMGVAKDE